MLTNSEVRVTPGEHNLGIFINLNNRGDESYRLTHPAANLGGLLRGTFLVLSSTFARFILTNYQGHLIYMSRMSAT